MEQACSKIPGYVCLALGDPMQKRNYYRAGWLRFVEDADMSSVITELSEKKVRGIVCVVGIYSSDIIAD